MRLGLLLAMTGSAVGKYYAGAATLAIAAINADPSLMKGRRLEYIYADAGCNAIQGVSAALELLRAAKPIHGVIGAGCSSVCESTGFLTAKTGLLRLALFCLFCFAKCCAKCSHMSAAWPPGQRTACACSLAHILIRARSLTQMHLHLTGLTCLLC